MDPLPVPALPEHPAKETPIIITASKDNFPISFPPLIFFILVAQIISLRTIPE
jgi:hypothetical protein